MIQAKHKGERIIWILDPPYLNTNVDSYKKATYWTLKDYLDVFKLLPTLDEWVYFSSDKSGLIDLALSLEELGAPAIFSKARKYERRITINRNTHYKDIMLVNINA